MLAPLIRPLGAARLRQPKGGGAFAQYRLAPGLWLFLGSKPSHRLLRRALSIRHPHVTPDGWRFARSGWGQLLIEQSGDQPVPRFSLSATDGIVAVALCDDGPVGVDGETLARVALNASPGDSWLSREEQDDMSGLDGPALTVELACRWTLKEALGKAAGTGLVAPALLTIGSLRGRPIVTSAKPGSGCSLALFRQDDLIIGVAHRPCR